MSHEYWPMMQADEAVNEDTHIIDYPFSSFTPLNRYQGPPKYINSQESLPFPINREESIYDIPQDIVELEEPAKKRKPIAPSKLSKGRVVSLGPLWQYTDEGDVDNTGNEKKPLKRRKTALAKESQVVEIPAKQQFEVEERDDLKGRTPVEDGGMNDSQLITPQYTTKRDKKGSVTTATKKKKTQLPSFKNLTITKLMPTKEKGLADDVSSQVVSYQGWTATQDTVKHNSISVSQTTLDELTAFRYTPAERNLVKMPFIQQDRHFQPLGRDGHHPVPSLEAVASPSSTRPFRQAFWHQDTNDTHVSDEAMESHQDATAMNETQQDASHLYHQANVDDIGGLYQETEINGTIMNTPVPNFLSVPAPKTEVSFLAAMPSHSQQASLYIEPSSSEARAMSQLVDETRERDDDQLLDFNETQFLPAPQVTSLNLGYMANETYVLCGNANGIEVAETPHTEAPNTQCQKPVAKMAIEILNTEDQNIAEPLINVQTVASATVHPGLLQVSTSPNINGFDGCDEFDEGLDDSDFLAIPELGTSGAQEPIQLESPSSNLSGIQRSFHTFTKPQTTPNGKQRLEVGSQVQVTRSSSRSSSSIFLGSEPSGSPRFENDDMHFLSPIPAAVDERFEALTSVQHPFEDDHDEYEVFDSSLKFSPPKSSNLGLNLSSPRSIDRLESDFDEEVDWAFMQKHLGYVRSSILPTQETQVISSPIASNQRMPTAHLMSRGTKVSSGTTITFEDDSSEYQPLQRFVRAGFPGLVLDRCPIVGFSSQTFLRVCFRIGEIFKEAARCDKTRQDVVMELFARVTFSSREAGTTKQHFQFGDLWSDNPPFPTGVLANYKLCGLAENESEVFVVGDEVKLARCLGRLKRDKKSNTGWLFHIINIRETNWEEIRWTKRIVSASAPPQPEV